MFRFVNINLRLDMFSEKNPENILSTGILS